MPFLDSATFTVDTGNGSSAHEQSTLKALAYLDQGKCESEDKPLFFRLALQFLAKNLDCLYFYIKIFDNNFKKPVLNFSRQRFIIAEICYFTQRGPAQFISE